MNKWNFPLESLSELPIIELYTKKFAEKSAALPEQRVSEAVLVSLELASNAIKYGGGGSFEIKAKPGEITISIENKRKAPKEIVSKPGLGTGLSSVLKYSDSVEITPTESGKLKIEVLIRTVSPRSKGELLCGISIRPYPGEDKAGDSALFKKLSPQKYLIFATDIAGHGPKAAELAQQLTQLVGKKATENLSLSNLCREITTFMKDTRGGAVFIGLFYRETIKFFNFGDLRVHLYSGTEQKWHRLPSQNFITGRNHYNFERHEEKRAFIPQKDLLLIHSDGVKIKELSSLSWLFKLHPQRSAERIVEQFALNTDDASAVVIKGIPP